MCHLIIAEGHLGIAPGISTVMPSATGTPPRVVVGVPCPPRVLVHPELLQADGEKTGPAGGESFSLLFYYFILKPKAASLEVEAAAAAPQPRGEGWMLSPAPGH